MIDFIKCKIASDKIDELLDHPSLDWKVDGVSIETGDVPTNRIYAYILKDKFANKDALKLYYIEGKERHLYLSGSIHKQRNYWIDNTLQHYKSYNDNDFSFSDFCNVITHLTDFLNCDGTLLKLENVEIGLNTITPFNHNPFLFDGLLSYNYKNFVEMQTKYKKRIGVKAQQQQYELKIYSKQRQYGRKEKVLRYELHFNKMQPLKKIGIETLQDLTDKDKFQSLVDKYLLKSIDKIIFAEPCIDKKRMTKKERLFFEACNNPKRWNCSIGRNQSSKSTQRKRDLEKFRLLNDQYTDMPQMKDLKDLLINKSQDMIKSGGKKCLTLTNIPIVLIVQH